MAQQPNTQPVSRPVTQFYQNEPALFRGKPTLRVKLNAGDLERVIEAKDFDPETMTLLDKDANAGLPEGVNDKAVNFLSPAYPTSSGTTVNHKPL